MSEQLEAAVPEGLAGERVDRAVAMLTDLSRSAVSRLIDAEGVSVNGEIVTHASRRVELDEVIVVQVPDSVDPAPQPDSGIVVDVVHEDEHILVIDKPAGLVVHPGAGHQDGTLVNGLVHRYPEIGSVGEAHRPGIVHRLDRGTSGLLVVARTGAAHGALVEQMSAHEPERIYRALVWGHPASDAGTIDAPIGRSTRHPTRMTVTENGRRAVTHYRVDDRFDDPVRVALLTCRLETGRTHQIRVHLRAIGHPVVGDRDYDGGRPGLDPGRPFLHAGTLRFRHPVSGEPLEFESDLPTDLAQALEACRGGTRPD